MYSSEEVETTTYTPILQEIVKRVEQSRYHPSIHQIFSLQEIVEVHRVMEASRASGKLVVVVD